MKPIFEKIRNFRIIKYFVAFLLFGIWITFFDESNLIEQHSRKIKLTQLQEQELFYRNKIKSDQRKLAELQTNDETLEKFAREQFQMKKENEDVYVIVEEK